MLYFGPWSADNKHIISVINFPSTTLHPKMIYKKDFLLCGLLTNVIRSCEAAAGGNHLEHEHRGEADSIDFNFPRCRSAPPLSKTSIFGVRR